MPGAKLKTDGKADDGGGMATYLMMMAGPYLHWEGYEKEVPRTLFIRGLLTTGDRDRAIRPMCKYYP
jgi:hypothetical protein